MPTIPNFKPTLPILSFVITLALWASPWAAQAGPPSKGQCTLCEHSPPQLWVVNSRCAPRCEGLDAGFEQLTYIRWDTQLGSFVKETRESLLAAQANIPTVLFSHGNMLTHEEAMESGWTVYERLRACPGPKMLVLWSWPAEILYKKPLIRPIELARKNIRAKYVYAEHQGYYIAKLANMMSLAQPLTLSGHSFGGVTVVCASHFLGGGELNGLVLEDGTADERQNLRVAIISGAMDNDSVYPGYRYGQAFAPVETFYTTFNDHDATLKHWPTHSLRNQEAVGYTGICAARLGPYSHKLFQQRLTEDVGRSHYMRPHLASNQMIAAICKTAFGTDVSLCPCGSGRSSAPTRGNFDLNRIIEVPAQTLFPGIAF